MKKPVDVLVLVALPTELNKDKNRNITSGWTKESLDNLIKSTRSYINAESKVNLDIRFTSVGKVNMAGGFMKAISSNKNIKYVINIGSAGSIADNGFQIGDIVQCDYAVETDLDLTGILTNFTGTNINELNLKVDNEAFHQIDSEVTIDSNIYKKAICGSSDKFPIAYGDEWYSIKNIEGNSVSVLDQEAAGLSKLVIKENDERKNYNEKPLSLIVLKYISNQITKEQLISKDCKGSGEEWLQELWNSDDCPVKSLDALKFVIDKIAEYENTRSM